MCVLPVRSNVPGNRLNVGGLGGPKSAAIRGPLGDALADLPESLRSVVVLKDVYEWTHVEIAEHLDITVTAAKVRLHRARKSLRLTLWSHQSEEGA